MKLKTWNTLNGSNRNGEKPCLSVNRKSGVLCFNEAALDMIGLKSGSQIELLEDEESPKDWYIGISSSEEGFKLTSKDRKSGRIQSKMIAGKVLDATGCDNQSARFLLSQEPIDNGGGILSHHHRECKEITRLGAKHRIISGAGFNN